MPPLLAPREVLSFRWNIADSGLVTPVSTNPKLTTEVKERDLKRRNKPSGDRSPFWEPSSWGTCHVAVNC